MGNKITRVVVEGSQGDINSAAPPIPFFVLFMSAKKCTFTIQELYECEIYSITHCTGRGEGGHGIHTMYATVFYF